VNEESASSCGWDILSQAVLGASCSKFCDANEEATAPSLHRTDLCGERSLPKKKSPKPQLLKSVSSGALRGKSLPKNPPSDSFISYRIADVKSADQVALEAGNSPSTIFKHYRELTTGRSELGKPHTADSIASARGSNGGVGWLRWRFIGDWDGAGCDGGSSVK
jgi:hypothetical protein